MAREVVDAVPHYEYNFNGSTNSYSVHYEVIFDDGSSEIFTSDLPIVGWKEVIGKGGVRTGWVDRYGMMYNVPTSSCSCCKKTLPSSQIRFEWNWGMDEKFSRRICSICYTRTLDKIFGVVNNIDTELILFDQSKKK